jgi:hypothetical protein
MSPSGRGRGGGLHSRSTEKRHMAWVGLPHETTARICCLYCREIVYTCAVDQATGEMRNMLRSLGVLSAGTLQGSFILQVSCLPFDCPKTALPTNKTLFIIHFEAKSSLI